MKGSTDILALLKGILTGNKKQRKGLRKVAYTCEPGKERGGSRKEIITPRGVFLVRPLV